MFPRGGEQIISKLGQSILSHLVPFTNAQVGAFYVVSDDKKIQMVIAKRIATNLRSGVYRYAALDNFLRSHQSI